MQRRCKYNDTTTGVARGVFYVVRIYALLGNGCIFCAVLRTKQPQTHQVAGHATMEPRVLATLPQHEQQKAVSQFGLQM
jgi:hypothetical protein